MSVNKRLNRLLQDLEKSSSVSYSSSTTRDGIFVNDPLAVDDVDGEAIVTSSNIVLKRKLVENMSNILFAATERKKRKNLDISSTIDNDNNKKSYHKPMQRINDEGGNETATDLTNVPTSLNDIHMNNMTVLPSSIDNCTNQNIVNSIHELRNVYLHGLQTVSKLQDLRDAPDAILPGNFCI